MQKYDWIGYLLSAMDNGTVYQVRIGDFMSIFIKGQGSRVKYIKGLSLPSP